MHSWTYFMNMHLLVHSQINIYLNAKYKAHKVLTLFLLSRIWGRAYWQILGRIFGGTYCRFSFTLGMKTVATFENLTSLYRKKKHATFQIAIVQVTYVTILNSVFLLALHSNKTERRFRGHAVLETNILFSNTTNIRNCSEKKLKLWKTAVPRNTCVHLAAINCGFQVLRVIWPRLGSLKAVSRQLLTPRSYQMNGNH